MAKKRTIYADSNIINELENKIPEMFGLICDVTSETPSSRVAKNNKTTTETTAPGIEYPNILIRNNKVFIIEAFPRPMFAKKILITMIDNAATTATNKVLPIAESKLVLILR